MLQKFLIGNILTLTDSIDYTQANIYILAPILDRRFSVDPTPFDQKSNRSPHYILQFMVLKMMENRISTYVIYPPPTSIQFPSFLIPSHLECFQYYKQQKAPSFSKATSLLCFATTNSHHTHHSLTLLSPLSHSTQ